MVSLALSKTSGLLWKRTGGAAKVTHFMLVPVGTMLDKSPSKTYINEVSTYLHRVVFVFMNSRAVAKRNLQGNDICNTTAKTVPS